MGIFTKVLKTPLCSKKAPSGMKNAFIPRRRELYFLIGSRFLRLLQQVPFKLRKCHECRFHLHIYLILVFTTLHSPGQSSVLQSSVWCRTPGHSAPPCCGKGLLQNRCLVLLPPSQPLSQTVHEDHFPQAPSRAINAKMSKCIELVQFYKPVQMKQT